MGRRGRRVPRVCAVSGVRRATMGRKGRKARPVHRSSTNGAVLSCVLRSSLASGGAWICWGLKVRLDGRLRLLVAGEAAVAEARQSFRDRKAERRAVA